MKIGDTVNVSMEIIPEYWRGIVTAIIEKGKKFATIEGAYVVVLPIDKFVFKDNMYWEMFNNGGVEEASKAIECKT